MSWTTSLSKPREQFLLLLGPLRLTVEHFTMTILFTGCPPRERTWLVACWFVSQDKSKGGGKYCLKIWKCVTFQPTENCQGPIICTCLNTQNIRSVFSAHHGMDGISLGWKDSEEAMSFHPLEVRAWLIFGVSPGKTRCYKSPLLTPSTSLCPSEKLQSNACPVRGLTVLWLQLPLSPAL